MDDITTSLARERVAAAYRIAQNERLARLANGTGRTGNLRHRLLGRRR